MTHSAAPADHAAFARLVDEYRSTVCSIALAIVRDVATSEDIAQEVFVAAWQGLERLNNPDSVGPWLRQITRNRAHDRVRRRTREATRDRAVHQVAARSGGDAEGAALDAERERIVSETLDTLPDDTREAMLLFYREGESVRTVAALLELSEAAVKKRLSRARKVLRDEVAARFAEVARSTAPKAAFTAAVMASLSTTGPSVAAAATATTATGTGFWAKGLAVSGPWLGPALGVAGILFGMKHAIDRANTEAQRQTLRTATAVGVLHTVGLSAVVPFAHGSATVMWIWYALLIGGFALIHIVWVPRILAPTNARMLRDDPSAKARLDRERRLGWLGLVGGAVAGAVAVWFATT